LQQRIRRECRPLTPSVQVWLGGRANPVAKQEKRRDSPGRGGGGKVRVGDAAEDETQQKIILVSRQGTPVMWCTNFRRERKRENAAIF
jgi:hypothetical protein